MRFILWKELRENLKWASLLMVALAAALYYGLGLTQAEGVYYSDGGITLCRKAFLTATTFGCAGIGLVLGLVQVLPELNRDRWAALLHRPAPRWKVYAGKALAGVILYFLATGLPFLGAVYLAATPGYISAPFVPGMVLPGVADLFAGLVYYFAALLAALGFGTGAIARFIPLLAAFYISVFVQKTGYFAVAVEASVAMTIAMVVAGVGAIRHPHSLDRRHWLCRLAFVIILFYGVCAAGHVAGLLIEATFPRKGDLWKRYAITKAGTPLILTSKDGVLVDVRNLDGSIPTDEKYKPSNVQNQRTSQSTLSSYIGDSHGWTRPVSHSPYRDSDTYISPLNPFYEPRFEQWFEVKNPKILVGFGRANKLPIALFSGNGFGQLKDFARMPSYEGRLDAIEDGTYVLEDSRRLQIFSLPDRTLSIVDLPSPEVIYGVATPSIYHHGKLHSRIAVALRGGIAIYDREGKYEKTLAYQRDPDRWGDLEIGMFETPDQYVIRSKPSSWLDQKTKETMPEFVDIVTGSSEALASYELPRLSRKRQPPSIGSRIREKLQSPLLYFGTIAYRQAGALLGSERMQKIIARQFGPEAKQTATISLWISGLSILCAAVTWVWAARAGLSQRSAISWAFFSLAFNLGGLLVFRLAADRPGLIKCPACGVPRRTDFDLCPSCAASWPPPRLTGTEIWSSGTGTSVTPHPLEQA